MARTGLWRNALLTMLGVAPTACGALVSEDASPAAACGNSVLDAASGLATCDNGVVHRPAAATCENHLDLRPADAVFMTSNPSSCTRDAECTEKPYGRCLLGGVPLEHYSCQYGCLTDADCDDGRVCVCTSEIGECRVSNCVTDADCGDGFLCAERTDTTGCGLPTYACQTAEDTCVTDDDCRASGNMCLLDAERARHCRNSATCGRPFVVRGRVRTGARVESGQWHAQVAVSPHLRGLVPEIRESLGQHWARVGLMEHASIAAFARFTLQLLALGAPARLVFDSQRAQKDELEHAELAFALASAYLGHPVGPGPIEIGGALESVSLEAVVELAFVEGCVGETLAALEAAEGAAHCADRFVRESLERIARDERRHAELAWRFVAWALRSRPSIASHLRSVLDDVRAELAEPPAAAERDDMLVHGIVCERTRARLRREGLSALVVPCTCALLASVARAVTVGEDRTSTDGAFSPLLWRPQDAAG